MRLRIVLLIPPLTAAAGLTVSARADDRPDAGHPIAVSGKRAPAAEVFRRGLSGPAAGDLFIEAAWLRGELRERPGRRALRHLRALVADRLAAGARGPADFARRFANFHTRWRARTE